MRKTAKFIIHQMSTDIFSLLHTRNGAEAGRTVKLHCQLSEGREYAGPGRGDTLGVPMAIYLSAGRKEGLEAEHAIADVLTPAVTTR